MKHFIVSIWLLLVVVSGKAQEEISRLSLDVTHANGIYESHNENGFHCFYFDLNVNEYMVVVTDSDFNQIMNKKGYYHTAVKSEYLWAIHNDSLFTLFFKKVAENELMTLTVNLNNQSIVRNNSFKPFDSRGRKLIKYFHESNRLIAFTATDRGHFLELYEINCELEVEYHQISVSHERLTRFLDKGLLEDYRFSGHELRLLIHYESITEKLVACYLTTINLKSHTLTTIPISLDLLESNEVQLRKFCFLNGRLTKNSVWIALTNYKRNTITIGQFGDETGELTALITEEIPAKQAKVDVLDYTTLTATSATKSHDNTFWKNPFTFGMMPLNKDSVVVNMQYLMASSAKYLPPATYMRYEFGCPNTGFEFNEAWEREPPFRDGSLLQYISKRVTMGNEPTVKLDYANVALFEGIGSRTYMATIDRATEELVIERLHFNEPISIDDFNKIKRQGIERMPVVPTRFISVLAFYLQLMNQYSDFRLKPMFR